MEHEMLWKEVVAITLMAMFSFSFYDRIDKQHMYWGFILLSLIFYSITKAEEDRLVKKFSNYFDHNSSYFMLSGVFFLLSYGFIFHLSSTFAYFTLSVAVIMFSVGFMKLLFSRFENE